jgi:hypothetical protein
MIRPAGGRPDRLLKVQVLAGAAQGGGTPIRQSCPATIAMRRTGAGSRVDAANFSCAVPGRR